MNTEHPNEERADYGGDAIAEVARRTGVATAEPVETAIRDVLAYVAHFCDRCGLDPAQTFRLALDYSYEGDFEDGPRARPIAALDPDSDDLETYLQAEARDDACDDFDPLGKVQ